MKRNDAFSNRSERHAFTLTEVAIVLGVIGTILAGVWSLISMGWENRKREQAVDAITIVVANVRAFYG